MTFLPLMTLLFAAAFFTATSALLSRYFPECSSPGVYYQPDALNCSQRYFKCSDGQGQLLFCADGWAFQNATHKCVDMDLVPSCKKAPQGIISLTANDYLFDCTNKKDGNYTNNQSLCSLVQEVRCNKGVATILFCPATTRFDFKRNVCTYPKYIPACGGTSEVKVVLVEDIPATTSAHRPTHFLTTQIMDDSHGMEFTCATRIGNFPNPHKPCSRMFVICSPDGMQGAMCPAGSVYDKDSDKCDFPELVAHCGGHSSSCTTTTPSPATTKSAMNCDGLDPGNYPNPVNPCSNTFYTCTGVPNGIAQSCPGKTVFDPVMNRCDYRKAVPECGGSTTTVAPTMSTVTTTTTMAGTFDCATRHTGDYPDPQNRCAQYYFVCTGSSVAAVVKCPEGFYYDQEIHTCSKLTEVPECGGSRLKTTVIQQDPSPTAAPFSCMDRPEDKYAPPGVACADFYFECSKNLTILGRCPNALRYDEKLTECRPMREVPGCPGYFGVPGPFCGSKSVSGFYPKPNTCDKFFFCVSGQDFLLNCPPASAYNNLTNQCDELAFVQPPCGTARPLMNFNCTEAADGRYAADADCSCYYTCNNETVMKHKCPEGFAYDIPSHDCISSLLVERCRMQSHSDVNLFCKGKADGIYGHPTNCRRSLLCATGQTFMFYCWEEDSPYFDAKTKRCASSTDFCTSKTLM